MVEVIKNKNDMRNMNKCKNINIFFGKLKRKGGVLFMKILKVKDKTHKIFLNK